jgi:hypothetical protein
VFRIANRVPADPERGDMGQGDGVLRKADHGCIGPDGDDSGLGGMAPQPSRTSRRCSAGEQCVSHAALGEPAKLSRGNPGPLCFACGECSAASALGEAAARAKPASGPGDARRPLARGEGRRGEGLRGGGGRKAHTCSAGRCERPAVEGHRGARFCREHAEAHRAREWRQGRAEWTLTCERNLRDALATGDEDRARKWSALLKGAEGSHRE